MTDSDFPEDTQSPPRRRGRPVQMDQETREELVLSTASQMIAERGLEDVSVAAIARQVHMSKRTIYTMFDSREALLGACFARIGQRIFRSRDSENSDAPLEERLRHLLTLNEEPTLNEAPLELLRAVITSAPTYPKLACSILESGALTLRGHIARELSEACKTGELALKPEDCDAAAEMLMDMCLGNGIHKLLDPERFCSSPETRAARRDRAITLFLDGARPR
ncbi:TetR/AcrR family transcriptional regulator [Alloyangia pacifica]|uniref:TetR/AcrR family transcriptional regulator n=1 Tax=Alloyangia pacifica TaxID=311180 RepID=UPI001CFD8D4B|nr:TetR/AcrR family transcriptional regulator [Alloyangia pacifica]